MTFEKTKNSKRNIAFGFFEKTIIMLLPFVIRTVMNKEIGTDYLGLNSLFTSILTVLSMAELGFSSAIVYSMYKPVAEGDSVLISALLNLYRKVYLIIGTVVLVVGLGVIPFLPYLINGDVPKDVSITVVYLVFLFNTTISYFGFAYYRSLIVVFQRSDIISKITLSISTAQYLLQIALIFLFHNYYIYVIVLPIFSLLNNIIIAIIARKMFPNYMCKGTPPESVKRDIKKNMEGLVVSKIGGVSRNAFDSIFVSAFLGLTEVTMYNNYYYISNAITSFMLIIINAISASVGNSVASDSATKNYNDLTKINFIYMWIAGWCTCCLMCLFQPFMKLWMGEELMLPYISVALFCLYFYVLKMGDIQSNYLTANGLFYEFRTCAIVQAIVNILCNYFLGKYFGINGVIAATIISIVFVDFAFGNRIVFKYYFKNNKEKEYYLSHLMYFIVSTISVVITFVITSGRNIFVCIIGCILIPNVLYVLLYHRMSVYQESMRWVLSILKVNNIKIKKLLLLK